MSVLMDIELVTAETELEVVEIELAASVHEVQEHISLFSYTENSATATYQREAVAKSNCSKATGA